MRAFLFVDSDEKQRGFLKGSVCLLEGPVDKWYPWVIQPDLLDGLWHPDLLSQVRSKDFHGSLLLRRFSDTLQTTGVDGHRGLIITWGSNHH